MVALLLLMARLGKGCQARKGRIFGRERHGSLGTLLSGMTIANTVTPGRSSLCALTEPCNCSHDPS